MKKLERLYKIGVFDQFWDGLNPHHLPFLHLRQNNSNKDWNIDISLERLDRIFKDTNHQTLIKDMSLLMKSSDWRNQLVFCISLVKLNNIDPDLIEVLWKEIKDYKSYVNFQLIATASIVDNSFLRKTKETLELINLNKSRDHNQKNIEELIINLNLGLSKQTDRIIAGADKNNAMLNWRTNLLKLIEEGKL